MKNAPKALTALLLWSGLALGAAAVAEESDYAAQWGIAVGSQLPMLAAQDHTGTERTLGDLKGRRGLLLLLVRSADW